MSQYNTTDMKIDFKTISTDDLIEMLDTDNLDIKNQEILKHICERSDIEDDFWREMMNTDDEILINLIISYRDVHIGDLTCIPSCDLFKRCLEKIPIPDIDILMSVIEDLENGDEEDMDKLVVLKEYKTSSY